MPNTPKITYAGNKDDLPSLNGPHDCFYYVIDEDGNEVRGINLDQVIRLAPIALTRKIVQVGSIGL